MLFIAHLCNHIPLQVVGGAWGTALQPVRGVGSGSRDVDDWTQTTLYAEDRGPPSTDDPGASPVRLCRTAPGMLQGHRYLGVSDPRRKETFASKRRHPDSQNPPL